MTQTLTETDTIDLPSVQPLDRHNRRWVGFVHPHRWSNPRPSGRYNLLVIGAGPAGLVVAAGAAGLGARVALVEKHLMGGDCLNVGCVPSKALLRCARAAADVRDAAHFGVRVPDGARVDFPAVMERMRLLRAGLSQHDSAERFRDEFGIDVYIGEGRFTSERAFEIGGRRIEFSRACIATGARAADLPIAGLAEVGALTNETVFTLTDLPKRLGVIGAGPIGCELAQAFARFGSEVVLVEALHGIMPREDRKAARIVAAEMARDGVRVLCCGNNLVLRREADGKHLSVDSHESHHDEVVDAILVGVGRAANVENLDLETAGVAYDKTGIRVDDRLLTTNRRIFAAGDVCSKYKFTHAADAMARIVIQNALFFGRARASALVIPWCTYTDPEVAHVGIHEQEAEEAGIAIDTIEIQLSQVDRAVLDGEDRGFVKVHLKKGTDRILGATIVARHGGDMIAEIALAMTTAKGGLGSIARTIHPYPTQAEALKKAADSYNRTRLTPRVKKIFEIFLRWRR